MAQESGSKGSEEGPASRLSELFRLPSKMLLALKFLEFPEYISPWDALRLAGIATELLGGDFGGAMEAIKGMPAEDRFVTLALMRAKELVEVTGTSFNIKPEDAAFWTRVRVELSKAMSEIPQLRSLADSPLDEILSVLTMLASIYLREKISFFKAGQEGAEVFNIPEDALREIIRGLSEVESLEALNPQLAEYLRTALCLLRVMVSLTLKFATEEERGELSWLLEDLSKFGNSCLEGRELMPKLKDTLPALLTILLQLKVHGKMDEEAEAMEEKLLGLLESGLLPPREFEDIGPVVYNVFLTGRAPEEFSGLGRRLLEEMLRSRDEIISERVVLRLPVVARAQEIPSLRVILNLTDELSEMGVAGAVRDATGIAVNWSLGVKLLASYRMMSEKGFVGVLKAAYRDVYGSVAIMFSLGPLAAAVFDQVKFFMHKGKLMSDARRFVRETLDFLKGVYRESEKAILDAVLPRPVKQVLMFPLYREALLVSMRISSALRQELEGLEEGRELLDVIDRIISEFEKLRTGKPEKPPEAGAEDIASLYT